MNFLTSIKSKIENYKSSTNKEEKSKLLKALKLSCIQLTTLPPSDLEPKEEEYEIAREVCELEMDFALEQQNEKLFELSYLRVKQFYFDFDGKVIKKRSDKFLYYVGLYLLHLLSNNRTSDFSTAIELIDLQDLNNQYIKISRNIEQCIMEGNYRQLAELKNTDKYYNYYLGKFDNAIRFQIARSAEKSYDSLKISDAVNLLMLNNSEELNNFVKEQNEGDFENREIDWKISGDRILFIPLEKEKESIPAHDIIRDTFILGNEVEKII